MHTTETVAFAPPACCCRLQPRRASWAAGYPRTPHGGDGVPALSRGYGGAPRLALRARRGSSHQQRRARSAHRQGWPDAMQRRTQRPHAVPARTLRPPTGQNAHEFWVSSSTPVTELGAPQGQRPLLGLLLVHMHHQAESWPLWYPWHTTAVVTHTRPSAAGYSNTAIAC
jgi:hypothetical protein